MELLLLALQALNLRDWYLLAGACLTLAVQVLRKHPLLREKLWLKVPDGWRWAIPCVAGAIVAFTGSWATGAALSVALVHAVGGALAIGGGSMGLAATLKESPVKWDGKAGGK